jgi:uncharacterized protein
MDDADVPAWWRALGVPGLVDVHVHFMPSSVMTKVWAYFDNARARYGVDWPIHYRGTDAERLAQLRALGVWAFPALVYPHKPGMAQWLSEWARGFAAETPGCVPTGTFYPEPGATAYVRAALETGTRIFKVHVQVGDFDPADPSLGPVWGMISDAAVPVVVHSGSGPIAGTHTGPGRMAEVLRRHPKLTAVIAHGGAPEYAEHLALARRFPNVHIDTTMVGTQFLERIAPVPAGVRAGYAELGERIVLGSDFPNIPYPYAEQLDALERWNMGDNWLRQVVYENGARLLGL